VIQQELWTGGALFFVPLLREPLKRIPHFGETVEARLIKQQLDQALARAEVPMYASCYCRQQAAA
jgi:hypothetical protein